MKCQCLKAAVAVETRLLYQETTCLLSKIIHILQFLHQLFNMSALLLDDALLKCVVTHLSFQLLLLGHLTFHKVAS